MALRNTSHRAKMLSGVAGLIAAALPAVAHGQDAETGNSGGLEEIIVTAQRREELLREVPIAVNAISGESLKDVGISDTNSLVQAVPSLNFTRSGPSGIFIIRGVATPNGAQGEEGSTAVYVDDVYMPDLAQTINKFNNIERIEVLNGPQGTLFGRNAVGGLIRIMTRDPGDRAEFNGQVGVGNYDTFSGQAYVSTPLGDNIGWNVAFTGQDQGRGFGRGTTLNRRIKTDDFWSLRSKLVARPSERLKVTLAGDYFKTENDTALFLFPVSFNTTTGISTGPIASQNSPANFAGGTRIRAWGVSAKAELDFDFATLTSISSYRKLRNQSTFDIDGGPNDILRLAYSAGSKSFQQEIRLASATTTPLSWQVGVFYLRLTAFQDQTQSGLAFAGLPGGSPPNRVRILARGVTDSISAFGEATYEITPTTHLTGGLRWTSDHRKLPVGSTSRVNSSGTTFATFTNALDSVTYKELTFRAALRQDLSDTVNVYASVNRGFKSGQFNLQTPQDAPVKPQTIMAYEAGLKGDFLDNHLRVSVAAYHYDIDDYQIRSSPAGVSVLANAAKVKIDGVDLNVEAAPTSRLRLTAGASWLDARYASFPRAVSGSVIFDASGNKTALAPEFTFNASGTYIVPFENGSELRFTAAYTNKSHHFFEPDNILRQPAYDVVNGSVEYKVNEHMAFEVWMRNIGDELYNVQMVTSAGQAALAGAPRQYGINFKVTY